MKKNNESHLNRAVVIGGSVAGLLAARVLSDHFEEVVIIERDRLPDSAEQRRGVPQGYHAHALLAGGQGVVEKLFPGISDQLIADGAVRADPLRDGTWFFEGAALYQTESGLTSVLASRPFLEQKVRARVKALDRVQFLDARSVRELESNSDNSRVTGVVLDDHTLGADLVIDATGRGSRTSAWLESLGYKRPRQENVEVDLVYTTRLFRLSTGCLGKSKFVVLAPTPDEKRGGVIGVQEEDKWIVTLFGHFGNVAPKELDGFVDYARTLPSPTIYDAIRDAESIGDATTFRFPASQRRRYEELGRFPDGLLVFGDAICSFNPIYGQGMSVAALQADALNRALATGTDKLATRFFKMAAKVIDNPWNIAVGGDLKMPETVGPRSRAVNAINWYIGHVHRQAHTDPDIALTFNRVSQLLDGPEALMRPGVARRVLLGALHRRFFRSVVINESLPGTVKASRHLSGDGF